MDLKYTSDGQISFGNKIYNPKAFSTLIDQGLLRTLLNDNEIGIGSDGNAPVETPVESGLDSEFKRFMEDVDNMSDKSAGTYVSMIRQIPDRMAKSSDKTVESPFDNPKVLTDGESREDILNTLQTYYTTLQVAGETTFDINKTKSAIQKFRDFIEWKESYDDSVKYEPHYNENLKNFHSQVIYFGAPGTGKSYSLNQTASALFELENVKRTTFHPSLTYGQFVGLFKPVPAGDAISYRYVPGVLIQQLVKALLHPDSAYLVIIEEINRANAAAVFGDFFQLLDRDENNESEYPINISEDLNYYLDNFVYQAPENADYVDGMKQKINAKGGLFFPGNLYIWSTMNSADQGVSPLDTAFKRRWNQKYFGINDSFDEKLFSNFGRIITQTDEADGVTKTVGWNDLRMAINNRLSELNVPEDKLLGPFFLSKKILSSDSDTVTEAFKDKVLMYLFEDAAKQIRSRFFNVERMQYSEVLKNFDQIGIDIFKDIAFDGQVEEFIE